MHSYSRVEKISLAAKTNKNKKWNSELTQVTPRLVHGDKMTQGLKQAETRRLTLVSGGDHFFIPQHFTVSLIWNAQESIGKICAQSLSHVWLFATPRNVVHQGPLSMGILQARTLERAASYTLLKGIFPNQGLNPGLPHYRWILYHLNYQGSPRLLEWVACPLSRGTS